MSQPDVPSSGGGSSSPLAVLTKKVGPLPGWAWVALAVGAYAAYRMWTSRNGGTSPTTATDTTILDPSSQPVSGDASASDGGLGSGLVNTGGSQIVQTTPVGAVTNAQWGTQAVRILSAASPASSAAINNAVTKYLSGKPLTSAENAIVIQAIQQLGPPPEGLIPITVSSVMNPPKGTTYTHHTANNTYIQKWPDGSTHTISKAQWVQLGSPKAAEDGTHGWLTYTTKKGDTLHLISMRYYGYASDWIHLANWNHSLQQYGENGKLPAGVVMRIPEGFGKLK